MRRKNISIISLITAITMALTGCGSSVYEKSKSDYTQVSTVKAASFEVPTTFVSKATAISTISENEEYDGLYIFKDGATKYVMFDTSLIVIACGKTDFGFKGNETEETLEAKSIEGVWLSSDKFNYSKDEDDGIYKIVADDLDAEYSLTKTQYCKLKGSMASISDGKTEYSIFAGAVISDEDDSLDSEQEKIIKHVVRSFRMNDAEEMVEPVTEENEDNETDKTDSTEDNKPEVEVTEEIQEDIAEEGVQTEEETPEEEADASQAVDEVETTEETEETEDIASPESEEDMVITVESDTTDDEVSEETVSEEENDEADQTEPTEEDSVDDSDEEPETIVEEAAQEDDWELVEINPLKSTVYKPLTIGQWGMAGCITADGEQTVVDIRVDNIITGKDATKLIKQYNGRKSTPLEGTSFVVVEYTTDSSEKDAYVNLRFCGVDGERLKLRGVSYTTRSYDLDNTEEMQAEYTVPTYAHRYAYYEVPTGCKEYLLVFGEHIKEMEDIPTANYLINVK